jgi:hypothetical protein
VRLGTRGSALALAQAQQVAFLLGTTMELVTVTTTGDRDRTAGDKSRWVKELELALLEGRIDLAVHSAKDVPAVLPDGLALVATPPRADPYDALCGASSLDALASGARVLVHDDLLATGGTARALCDLVERLGGRISACAFLIELAFLGGRERLQPHDVHALIAYDNQ